MQVTRIEPATDHQVISTRKQVTPNELQQEIDYYRSQKILQNLLDKGLISASECKKIDELNRQSFQPNLAQIMA